MNVERLRRLETLLRADAANPTGVKFDLGSWAEPDASLRDCDPVGLVTTTDYGKLYWNIGAEHDLKPVIPMSCQTHACALGLAALDPDFKKDGLDYRFVPASRDYAFGMMVPTFEGEEGMHAGARFFGISYSDSRYLFEPDCYEDCPREAEGELFVAARVADLIDGIRDMDHHPDRDDEADGD